MSDADLESSYTYDAQGRVQRVANAAATRTFGYDGYSRLNSESVTIDSLTRTTNYSYDGLGRLTRATDDAGSYSYDGGNMTTHTPL